MLQATEQRFPFSPWRKLWWGRLAPWSPWRSTVEQISSFRPGRTPHQIRWVTEGGCDPMESPCWSRFAGRACDPVGDPHWSILFLKDCTPWKGSMLELFMKNCSPWEGRTLEQFMENSLLWEGPHAGAGAECEESSPWRGRSGSNDVWWTDCKPHSPSFCATRGRRERNFLGIRGRWYFFWICFYFPLSYSDLIGNKLN